MTDPQPGFFALLATHPALFVTCSVLLGLMIGSFLNVVIHRLPIMMDHELRAECAALAFQDGKAGEPRPQPAYNIVTPRSACPKCKAPITALQNIPVISWLALRGKCASCRNPISARYPLVELATGVLSGFIAWRFGFGLTAVAALAFTWFLVALTLIDFDTQFLPDALTYPLLWLGLLLSLWYPIWGAGAAPVGPRDSIIGAVAGYLSLWSLYWAFKLLTGKEGMGYGDFKLFAALGAWFGWQALVPIILMASIIGAVIGIAMKFSSGLREGGYIPFGPFLAGAGLTAMIFGPGAIMNVIGL